MKKIGFIALGIVLAGFVAVRLVTRPPLLKIPRLVEIPEKYTAAEIARLLKQENIIRRESWFLYLTKRWRVQDKLQAGIYEFRNRTPLRTVIRKLVKGQVVMVRLTIPEGATCKDIGRILENKSIVSQPVFEEYSRQKNLEGFLLPDTYFFPVNVSMETVVNKILTTFRSEFAEIYGKEISRENEKEVKKIVTIASIVEKEAEIDLERPIIAGILYNRLKKGLPLQCCATIEYALGVHKSRLTNRDLRTKSPYNTYLHRGLPPTPICNPGKRALLAALRPARTEYLFFVTRGDGTHYFSRTHQEHLQAKQIYLDNRSTPDTSMKTDKP